MEMKKGLISWASLLLLGLSLSLAGAETLKFSPHNLEQLPWALNSSAFEITGGTGGKCCFCSGCGSFYEPGGGSGEPRPEVCEPA